jgi:DNA primase
MAFSDSFLEELAARNDIVDVVSGYVRLGKKSGSNMFGLCPFHSERTPSFSVNPDRQIYHCFGCGKGGGVINFIMEIENFSFPEAVEFLAKRVGMELPEQSNDAETRRRSKMLAVNKDAARYFRDQLSTPAGAAARRYIAERQIGDRAVKIFGLGYAPKGWTGLLDAMHAKGYTDFELFDAGLVSKGKRGGYYDKFRDRLMFPVIDIRGEVIGFSGRILSGDGPKYMNSPETLVFNKSRNLFAMNLAKKSKCGYIILAEGNVDVVSLHQAGFDSAVASLGTSLTPEQARLLSRFTNEVIIAYDNDGAGIKASQRAIGILEQLDVRVKVLSMSGAKDPDEFIKLKGPDAFRNLIEASENQEDYRLRLITKKYDLSVDEQKIEFLKEASEFVAKLPDAVKRQVYGMRVASQAGVNADVVTKEIEQRRKRMLSQARRAENREQAKPERQAQPPERELRYENPASATAEEGLIRLLYMDAGLTSEKLPDEEKFSSKALAHIYAEIKELLDEGRQPSSLNLSELLSMDEMNLLVRVIQKPEVLSNSKRALADYIATIEREYSLKKEKESKTIDFDKIREEKQDTPYDSNKGKK